MTILRADGLVKIYGRRRVVDGVSLEVNSGEIVGLLGPNGAGKTTSFKMMCGIVKPNRGKVFLQGKDVTQWPMYLRSREGGMGYLPQKSSVFAKLNCEQNLKGMMQLLGFSRRQQKSRCQELLEQFKITHIRKSKAGDLSGGERRRLEIARCLVSNPQIIMLDEPFAGIDPVTVQSIQVVIKELSQQGIAVLITDHAAREILQVTDRTYVVSAGQILCSGSAEEIVQHDEVKSKYLGEIELPGSSAGLAAATSATSHSSIATGQPHRSPDAPKIIFSKPRTRKTNKVVAPFRSTDLD
jgi:lipopolysaccharide export system ATP-binding protein